MKELASKSILQGDTKECYVCRKRYGMSAVGGLQRHHIYYGNKNRSVSEKNGFWVWLMPIWHNASNVAVHCKNGAALDLELKRDCQRKFEETHTREEFLSLIGRNYLDE